MTKVKSSRKMSLIEAVKNGQVAPKVAYRERGIGESPAVDFGIAKPPFLASDRRLESNSSGRGIPDNKGGNAEIISSFGLPKGVFL